MENTVPGEDVAMKTCAPVTAELLTVETSRTVSSPLAIAWAAHGQRVSDARSAAAIAERRTGFTD
jgi:hypothetical protein